MELPNGFEWASVLNSGAPLDINNAGLPICIALGNGTLEGYVFSLSGWRGLVGARGRW